MVFVHSVLNYEETFEKRSFVPLDFINLLEKGGFFFSGTVKSTSFLTFLWRFSLRTLKASITERCGHDQILRSLSTKSLKQKLYSCYFSSSANLVYSSFLCWRNSTQGLTSSLTQPLGKKSYKKIETFPKQNVFSIRCINICETVIQKAQKNLDSYNTLVPSAKI